MSSLANTTLSFKSFCKVDFSGGDLSYNCGLMLLGQFMNNIGITSFLKENFSGDSHRLKRHNDADILLQLILQNLSGSFKDDTADQLAYDPIMNTILHKNRLASQPTISRFWNRLDDVSVISADLALKFMRKQAYALQCPSEVIFDIDTTILPTYGAQSGGEFIHHYQEVGYHPMLCYDGNTGDLLKAELREGSMYCGNGAADFIEPLLTEYAHQYPDVKLLVRGDSGFAMPDLYDTVEKHPGARYIIRLKDNSALQAKVQDAVAAYMEDCAGKDDFPPRYGEFRYAAKSWSKERRVVYKIELRKTEGSCELFPTCTFIVTNKDDEPKEIIQLYCKRGNMENFIKESKNEFGFCHMCSSDQTTNENRLLIAGLAYNIFNLFRRLCLPKKWQSFRASELRLRMIHIAGRHIKHAKEKLFRLCSTYMYKEQFLHTYNCINRLDGLLPD